MKWEENVRRVVPYTPGEQPQKVGVIKLNTNECPYPPAPGVARAAAAMEIEKLRLYPAFPEKTKLAEALAAHYHIGTDQLFIGVGSDDVLSLAFMTFFNSGEPILFPDITYSFYDVWADVYKIPYETKPLDADFQIRPEDYRQPNGGVVFPNPNAPTGVLMPLEKVEEIVAANRGVVVIVDEAYIDFGGTSALPLIEKYDNLLVVQTFSKSRAMAGMRIGFAMGQPTLIRYLNDVKYSVNSYTMNTAALELGVEAVRDEAYFEICRKKIMDTRARAEQELARLGFVFPKSCTNFIFASHKTVSAHEIFEQLKENDIYVRWWNKARIDNYLRITIGTDEQMEALYRALGRICG
ncbi:MAG: histidinol-phosphate transaminase [Bacteroidales bacterium]|nr:histidinol-phosphate transaminase [Bacteroidales bacterium]MCM1416986.1 histidinol-phosphate transaminase [bacterium]MCM1422829.1 histidinol-phosphate transaminase [bacterium]